MHYFGPWEDPEGTFNKYLEQRDDLHAGRAPRVQADGFMVRDLLNHFLTAKRHLLDTREITNRTFLDYHGTCERIGGAFGLTRLVDDLAADDFADLRAGLAKTRGLVALGNEIQRVRSMFKHACEAGLIDNPGVPRDIIRRLPAILHRARAEGLAAQNRRGVPNFRAWVEGMIAYVAMSRPAVGQELRLALSQLAD